MVNTVVQGVKALQDLSRLRANFFSKRTKGGTKFVECTGQVVEVFEVDRLSGEVGRVWEWQRGGSELDWLGNKQRIPGKRSIGNASSGRNVSLLENMIYVVHNGHNHRVCVRRAQ